MANRFNHGLRMLMADDSAEDIFFVERALQKSGVGGFFHAVHDGREAVEYLRGQGPYADRTKFQFPNILLLDIKMPVMDGFELLRWLQQHPDCKVIPTIAFSSSHLESDVHQVYALGGNAFIQKPSSLEKLTELIQCTHSFWSRCQTPVPPPGERCA